VGVAEGSVPVGAAAEILAWADRGAGARLQIGGSSGHAIEVLGGRATWTRVAAAVGGAYTVRRGVWGASAHADLHGARMSIAGDGFAVNRGGRQLALGIGAGARGMRVLGTTALWADVTAIAWPGRHEVVLGDAMSQARQLPRLEVALTLGMHFLLWP
jgi:hypothetical protein